MRCLNVKTVPSAKTGLSIRTRYVHPCELTAPVPTVVVDRAVDELVVVAGDLQSAPPDHQAVLPRVLDLAVLKADMVGTIHCLDAAFRSCIDRIEDQSIENDVLFRCLNGDHCRTCPRLQHYGLPRMGRDGHCVRPRDTAGPTQT